MLTEKDLTKQKKPPVMFRRNIDFFGQTPLWVNLLLKSIVIIPFTFILANIGITDYRHERNSSYASITGMDSFFVGIVLCFLNLAYNILYNMRIVENIKFDDQLKVIEIDYVYYFVKRVSVKIDYGKTKFYSKLKKEFRYFNLALSIIDNEDNKKYVIKTNRFGWTKEQINSISAELKLRVLNSSSQ